MKMTAQYTPYRNEDGMETEQVTWGDQDVGDSEIYHGTTEAIKPSQKNLCVGGITLVTISILVGILIGYFIHSQHTSCVPSLSVALHSVQEANPYVRRKITQMVSAEEIEKFIKTYSLEPHTAGSATDRYLAKTIKKEWLKYGMDNVEIAEYDVLLSYPNKDKSNVIEVVGGKRPFKRVFPMNKNLNPPFSAYSATGNVTGDLVYVNYGEDADFKHLQKQNIPLEGSILIARQWKIPADEIVWNAQDVKAAGLILYPDPNDYNNPPVLNSKPFPDTWWLPPNVARTDSIMWNGAGDPLTPGYPARHDANRLDIHSVVLPSVVVQPVSYADAYELMQGLSENQAPREWQGGFNFTYSITAPKQDPRKVNMMVYNDLVNKTIYNVVGTIRGKTEPDRYVLVGGHRDAWAYGAVDAAGGTAALLELSRVFGQLLKEGWRPRRTILFCSWGAEEHNLIGSTEWLEDNIKILHGRAVAYINADILVAGNASVRVVASPLLYHTVFNATREVANPNQHDKDMGLKTVYDSWITTFPKRRNVTNLLYPNYSKPIHDDDDEYLINTHEPDSNHMSLLDSYLRHSMQLVRPMVREMDMRGNYAPFFALAGIPVVDVSYIHDSTMSSSSYPLHHTEFDNFNFVKSLIDPTFQYHATVVKILGELLRDLSDSLFLPFNLFDYAQVLQDFFRNLNTKFVSILLENNIKVEHLEHAIHNFSDAAMKFHSAQEKVDLRDPMTIRRINDQLLLLERAFLEPNGLPRNPYKKHILMSPAESRLSSSETFPGLLDEIANLQADPLDLEFPELIKAHFSVLVFTIQSAAKILRDV